MILTYLLINLCIRIKTVLLCKKRKTGSAYTNILRVAKALVVSKPIVAWQNLAEFGSGIILWSYNSKSTKFHCNFPLFSTCAVPIIWQLQQTIDLVEGEVIVLRDFNTYYII